MLLIIAIGAVLITLILVALFVILATKWSVKRGKEISARFDQELDNLQTMRSRIKQIEDNLTRLRSERVGQVSAGNKDKARQIIQEIRRLEKERSKLLKRIDNL